MEVIVLLVLVGVAVGVALLVGVQFGTGKR